MAIVLTLLLNGVANGALYFLTAAGLTLVFGLMRVLNFAQGGVYLWGGYVATAIFTATNNFLLAILGAIVASGLIGFLIEWGLIRPVYQNGTGQLLITMGAMLVLSEAIKIPFGPNELNSGTPTLLSQTWLVGQVVIIEYQVFIIVISVLLFLLMKWILQKSRIGITIRAGVHNPDLVEAQGIPLKRLFTMVFVAGAVLAGIAGALSGPYFGSVTPTMGFDTQLNAFIIIVVGGLGSLEGAFVGSFLIGIVTAVVSYYTPSLAILVNVLVMAAVLLVRPQGLWGELEGQR